MFGITIMTNKKRAELMHGVKTQAESDTFNKMVWLLRQKDKIYLDPLTLWGDNQTVTNCAFFGNPGMNIRNNAKLDDDKES
jgi:hypothetical protein